MDDCIFCKIINGEVPTKIEFEDDNFIAFNDINPKAKLHILIIPKKHFDSISILRSDDFLMMGELFKVAQRIAAKKAIIDSGYRLIINSGKDAGMAVKHLHLHLLGGEQLGDLNQS